MSGLLTTTFLYILMLLVSPSLMEESAYKLEMIAELFRHGARTSIKSPKAVEEPYIEQIGPGNLTPNGMRQHETLGKQLAQKTYPDLFKAPYTQRNAVMYSSGVLRAILSAQSHLAGLYPLGTGYSISVDQEDSKNMKPNPILPPFVPITIDEPTYNTAFEGGLMLVPVKSSRENDDITFRAKDACPKGRKEFDKNAKETLAKLDIELKD